MLRLLPDPLASDLPLRDPYYASQGIGRLQG